MFGPNDFRKASIKAQQDAAEDLSELTLGDISDIPIPAIVNAQIFGDAEQALYRLAFAKAKADGLSYLECVDSAFQTVVGARTQTQFGTTVSGENLPSSAIGHTPTPYDRTYAPTKAAGLSPSAAGILAKFKAAQAVYRK
jgi:hypothetical protein